MKIVFSIIGMMVLLPLLASDLVSGALLRFFGKSESTDAAFIAVLLGTIGGLLKVLWDANLDNHRPQRLYVSMLCVLLLPIASVYLVPNASVTDKLKSAYMILVVVVAITLPWLLGRASARVEHRHYWWALCVIALGISSVIFGAYHLIAVEVKSWIVGQKDGYSATSLLLVSPMAVGVAATAWSVMQYAPVHHKKMCATLSASNVRWIRTYFIVASVLSIAYGWFFTPSLLQVEGMTYIAMLRSAAVCSLLLLAPIAAVSVHVRVTGGHENPSWVSMSAAGFIVSVLCATVAAAITSSVGILSADELIYVVVVHGLLGLFSMLVYLLIRKLMFRYPWAWVKTTIDALTR